MAECRTNDDQRVENQSIEAINMNESDREILDHFIRTRSKTIELLRRIPDDWLLRTAEGEAKPLGKLFAHIAFAVDFWMEKCLFDDGQATLSDAKDKLSIYSALEATQSRLIRFFTNAEGAALSLRFTRPKTTRADDFPEVDRNETFTGRNRVLYLTQHEAHHRGKIVLALRQWGFNDTPFIPY